MSTDHVVIIGAGIAGLSAASYLARSGYNVTVLESHALPGGLCTSWKRGQYTIDYCVHWLMGTKEGSEFNQLWKDLGAFTNDDGSTVPIVNFDQFSTMGLSKGDSITLYSDLEALEKELLRYGDEDRKEVHAFIASLKKLGTRFSDEKTNILGSISQFLTLFKHLQPMKEYSKRFKSQILQELFSTEIPEDWSLIALTLGLSQQPYQCAGYPVGGSLNLAKNIEREAKRLGATFRYNSTVERIVVEDGVAKGVTLRGGEQVEADYVISAADGHTTLFGMLEGKYLSKPYQRAYESYPLFPSSIMVALGLKGDYSGYPHESSPYFKEPITLFDGSSHNRFNLNVYHYDPTLAPKGKTLITVMFNTWEGEKWQQLATDNPKQYEEEKKRLSEQVIDRLSLIIGPLEDKIVMVDVSTPHSVIRYTGNWQGSFEGFAPTKATLSKSLPKTLPGLKHFAMIGQWTTPGGGLPTAAKDGLDIAKKLCKEHGKPFAAKLS